MEIFSFHLSDGKTPGELPAQIHQFRPLANRVADHQFRPLADYLADQDGFPPFLAGPVMVAAKLEKPASL